MTTINGPLSEENVIQFHVDGCLFVEQFLDAEETRLLHQACRADDVLQQHAMGVKDASGRRTNLSLWNHPGNDIYGIIARSEKMVNTVEQLLGDEVYHYHSKYEDGMRAAAWDDVWTGPALEGAEKDISIRWRVEGLEGLARGTIGWPEYPNPTPSTLDFTTTHRPGYWFQPRWKEVWFPDAFAGTMAQLLCALEQNAEPEIGGRDNLQTMALVDACYLSAREHRGVEIREITDGTC